MTRASDARWVECRRLVGGSRDGQVPSLSPARVTRGGLNAGDLSAAEGTGKSLFNESTGLSDRDVVVVFATRDESVIDAGGCIG